MKLRALDARVLQRPALLSIERVNLLADHAADAFRRFESHLFQWPGERPVIVGLTEIPTLTEVLQQVCGKQRVALRFLVNQRDQLTRKIVWRKRRVDVFGDVLTAP